MADEVKVEAAPVVDQTPAAEQSHAPVESAASEAEPSEASSMTDAEQDDFVRKQVAKLQRQAAGEEEPAKSADEDGDKKRGPDGKFLPKEETVVEDPAPAVETPAATDKKPNSKPANEVEPVPTAKVAAFDFDAIMAEVDAEVKGMKFTDTEDGKPVEITGEQAFKDYGQIAEPLIARQNKAIQKIAEALQAQVADIRRSIEEPARASAENAMIAAVSEVVPDFPALSVDHRFHEFIDKNPKYAGLISTDTDLVDDMAYLVDKFRSAYGIAKPTEAKPKTATVKKETPKQSRAVQAALSSSRGGGVADGGDETDGMDEDSKVRYYAAKLQREHTAKLRDAGF